MSYTDDIKYEDYIKNENTYKWSINSFGEKFEPTLSGKSINKFISNEGYIQQSNIAKRFIQELYYVHFDFNWQMNSQGKDLLVQYKDNFIDNNPQLFTSPKLFSTYQEFLSFNVQELDIPGLEGKNEAQKLFNKTKWAPTGASNDSEISIKFIEDNDFSVDGFFGLLHNIGFNANHDYMMFYPAEYYFNIYIFPLRALKLKLGNADPLGILNNVQTTVDFTGNENITILKNCVYSGSNNYDLKSGGDSPDLYHSEIKFNYESIHRINKYMTGTNIILDKTIEA